MSNLDAFLTLIAISEGTQSIGDRGYNVIVGSTPDKPILFDSYADHPRIHVNLRHGLYSTAAGRYQVLAAIYDDYKQSLHLPDFSPGSQDAIAIQLIKERGAFADACEGRIAEAIMKCASAWASLPSSSGASDYGQHVNTLNALTEAFTRSGGVLA